MPRTGRPAMTLEQVQERIADYRSRYKVSEVNDAGFPVFPAGLRETPQHREWIALYQLFNRSRKRSGAPAADGAERPSDGCPICLRPVRPPGSTHQRCAAATELVRELGPDSVERIRAAAFPDPGRSAATRRKS